MQQTGTNPRGTREIGRLQTWRATTPGMWAWLAQRLAAIALIPLVFVHISYPYRVVTQFLLVVAIAFHGLLGVRVLLIDIGVNVRHEKVLIALAAVVALVFVLVMGRRLL